MKRTYGALLAVLTLLLAAPPAHASTVIERTNLRDEGAFAEWEYVDPDGTLTQLTVVVSRAAKRPGDQVFVPTLAVSWLRADAAGNTLVAGQGVAENFDFTVAANLATARVVGTVPVTDEFFGDTVDYPVEVTWTATGPTHRDKLHSYSKENGIIIKLRFEGDWREAQATGTVLGPRFSGDPNPTNLTPIPSQRAQILRTENGSLTIQTGHPATP
jgi:hypothetical protein